MIPLLHHNLKQNTTTDIPPEFQKALSNLIRIRTNQVLKMNFELLRVVKILKQHNIRLIPYKGLVLSLMAYGDSNFRSFDDLDILVSEDDDFKPKWFLLAMAIAHYSVTLYPIARPIASATT